MLSIKEWRTIWQEQSFKTHGDKRFKSQPENWWWCSHYILYSFALLTSLGFYFLICFVCKNWTNLKDVGKWNICHRIFYISVTYHHSIEIHLFESSFIQVFFNWFTFWETIPWANFINSFQRSFVTIIIQKGYLPVWSWGNQS